MIEESHLTASDIHSLVRERERERERKEEEIEAGYSHRNIAVTCMFFNAHGIKNINRIQVHAVGEA